MQGDRVSVCNRARHMIVGALSSRQASYARPGMPVPHGVDAMTLKSRVISIIGVVRTSRRHHHTIAPSRRRADCVFVLGIMGARGTL